MDTQKNSDTINRLENLFSILNIRFFDGMLQRPVITVSPATRRCYGWCTSWKAWTDKPETGQEEDGNSEGYYEINLCSEYIARPFEETVETLLHEMVHLFNMQEGIQDTSRSGYYHNSYFKEAAEQHGLTVSKTEKYGYSSTALNDEAKIFVQGLNQQKFELYRRKKTGGRGSAKQNTRKYVCPKCGTIIRATKDVHVICGVCNIAFKKAE